MSHPLGVVIHFEAGSGATQYFGWPFNSMAKIGNKYFGAGPNGLYQIGGDDDAGVAIGAEIESGVTDLGSPNQKRIRCVYLGGQFDGDMVLTTKDDAENERVYAVPGPDGDNQRSLKVPVGRDGKGRYWQLRLENEDGTDFSLDAMDVSFLVLARRP